MRTNRIKILEANSQGLSHSSNEAIWYSYLTPIYQIAYNLGKKGISLEMAPSVIGSRYGRAPLCGVSMNHRDHISEQGLSLVSIADEKEVGSVLFFRDRKLFDYCGLLLPYTGSDNEPLILGYDFPDYDCDYFGYQSTEIYSPKI